MPILEDRVKYAAKLYKEKRANTLLLSGGGIYKDRLETDIMLDLALKYGANKKELRRLHNKNAWER